MERLTGISRTFIRKIKRGGTACVEHYRKRPGSEIKKIIELENYDGWFYDLETSSGEFHCGVGTCHVHNSPRRGGDQARSAEQTLSRQPRRQTRLGTRQRFCRGHASNDATGRA